MTSIFLYGGAAFVLALVLAQLCKPLARRVDVVARPKADRWHREVVPLLGGVAIAGAVLITAVVAPVRNQQLLVLLAGSGVLFVVGLLDDLRPFKPQTKFVLQILTATAMASLGLQLHLTGYHFLDILLTLFWFVGITNAFNLLDNMDGLSAGIAAITAGFRLMFFLNDGDLQAAHIAACVVGACLGFLVHNFNPASIFMGDAGSLFLGFLVAGLSLAGTFPYSRSTVSVLLFPVLILLVPIFDTTFVTIARTLAGRPVSQGGRDHTSHRLVASGLSERGAVLMLYGVAMVCGLVAFHGYTSGLSTNIVFIVFLAIGLLLFGLYLGRVQVYPETDAARIPEGALVRLIDNFPFKRQVVTVLLDSLLILVAYYSAYRLRFEHAYADHEHWFVVSAPIVFGCQLFAFAAFRVYLGVWRYAGLLDVIRLAKASAVGSGLAIVALVILYRFEGFSRAVFVIDWVLLLMFVSASRLSFRIFEEVLRSRPSSHQRVLVYGAGDSGERTLRELRRTASLGREVIGFVDDNRWKHRTQIHGVPVIGGFDRLDSYLDQHEVDEVIVSSEKISADRLAMLAECCDRRGIRLVRTWPSLKNFVAS
jgi:UDP-GlcNAc:undecaprenyl-phosphate/decaprenyl-phosphate GlcNAc-1-phosphate transferase